MMSDSNLSSKSNLETTLAVYGTLAPGEENHDQMNGMQGTWSAKGTATVRGYLVKASKGIHKGYPGVILDDKASEVPIRLFQSQDLPAHWSRLDEFEGEGYYRVPVTVKTDKGDIKAYLYSVKPDFAE